MNQNVLLLFYTFATTGILSIFLSRVSFTTMDNDFALLIARYGGVFGWVILVFCLIGITVGTVGGITLIFDNIRYFLLDKAYRPPYKFLFLSIPKMLVAAPTNIFVLVFVGLSIPRADQKVEYLPLFRETQIFTLGLFILLLSGTLYFRRKFFNEYIVIQVQEIKTRITRLWMEDTTFEGRVSLMTEYLNSVLPVFQEWANGLFWYSGPFETGTIFGRSSGSRRLIVRRRFPYELPHEMFLALSKES